VITYSVMAFHMEPGLHGMERTQPACNSLPYMSAYTPLTHTVPCGQVPGAWCVRQGVPVPQHPGPEAVRDEGGQSLS
jgi:hypothetical protein